jgi:DNA-binding HxlR family transcriptional regulator
VGLPLLRRSSVAVVVNVSSEAGSLAAGSDPESPPAGMPLPKDYAGQVWTLLIVRDAFFGVRRFSDFAAHLAIPRAVLTHRLSALAEEGVLAIVPGPHGHDEYALTGKGLDLWPLVRSLLAWGDDYYSAKGPRRLFRHALDNGDVAQDGTCSACGGLVPPADLVVAPGPGWAPGPGKTDAVSAALAEPHRLLTSIRGS